MNEFKNALQKYVTKTMKNVNKEIDKAIIYANNELYEETVNMFNSFIHDYYLYKTRYYIRHWEFAPGTQQGQNLYYGMDIRKRNGKHPMLAIYLPINNGYTPNPLMADDYQHDSNVDVMANVVAGFRGVPNLWIKEWEGHYKGKYFSYTGNMQKAFDLFNNYFDFIAKQIIMNEMHRKGY